MLDTNMVSYIAKGHSKNARTRMLNLKEDEIACLSVITEAEICFGLAKLPEATALSERMEWLLAAVKVLPWRRYEAKPMERSASNWSSPAEPWRIWIC
jgi:tRNA(fMet)-specific endonuclease VapC